MRLALQVAPDAEAKEDVSLNLVGQLQADGNHYTGASRRFSEVSQASACLFHRLPRRLRSGVAAAFLGEATAADHRDAPVNFCSCALPRPRKTLQLKHHGYLIFGPLTAFDDDPSQTLDGTMRPVPHGSKASPPEAKNDLLPDELQGEAKPMPPLQPKPRWGPVAHPVFPEPGPDDDALAKEESPNGVADAIRDGERYQRDPQYRQEMDVAGQTRVYAAEHPDGDRDPSIEYNTTDGCLDDHDSAVVGAPCSKGVRNAGSGNHTAQVKHEKMWRPFGDNHVLNVALLSPFIFALVALGAYRCAMIRDIKVAWPLWGKKDGGDSKKKKGKDRRLDAHSSGETKELGADPVAADVPPPGAEGSKQGGKSRRKGKGRDSDADGRQSSSSSDIEGGGKGCGKSKQKAGKTSKEGKGRGEATRAESSSSGSGEKGGKGGGKTSGKVVGKSEIGNYQQTDDAAAAIPPTSVAESEPPAGAFGWMQASSRVVATVSPVGEAMLASQPLPVASAASEAMVVEAGVSSVGPQAAEQHPDDAIRQPAVVPTLERPRRTSSAVAAQAVQSGPSSHSEAADGLSPWLRPVGGDATHIPPEAETTVSDAAPAAALSDLTRGGAVASTVAPPSAQPRPPGGCQSATELPASMRPAGADATRAPQAFDIATAEAPPVAEPSSGAAEPASDSMPDWMQALEDAAHVGTAAGVSAAQPVTQGGKSGHGGKQQSKTNRTGGKGRFGKKGSGNAGKGDSDDADSSADSGV